MLRNISKYAQRWIAACSLALMLGMYGCSSHSATQYHIEPISIDTLLQTYFTVPKMDAYLHGKYITVTRDQQGVDYRDAYSPVELCGVPGIFTVVGRVQTDSLLPMFEWFTSPSIIKEALPQLMNYDQSLCALSMPELYREVQRRLHHAYAPNKRMNPSPTLDPDRAGHRAPRLTRCVHPRSCRHRHLCRYSSCPS